MAAKPSDSSRPQADLEVITRALPFETIPDEPLRAHFARWLLESLATADRLGPFPSIEPETPPQAIEPEAATAAAKAAPESLPRATDPAAAARAARAAPVTPSREIGPAAGAEPETRPREVDPASVANRARAMARAVPVSAAVLESSPAADPPGYEPLPLLEWQGPPAPPRPQFVRQRDGTVWLTRPILRTRGWTDSAIRDFLPEPEGLKPNPRFAATGAPMPVWRPATVAAAEAAPDWKDWLERSLKRRKTTLEALAETEDPDFRARLETARAAIEHARLGTARVATERERMGMARVAIERERMETARVAIENARPEAARAAIESEGGA